MLFGRVIHFVFLILPVATKATEHVVDDARFHSRDQGAWAIPPPEARAIGAGDKRDVSVKLYAIASEMGLQRRTDTIPQPPSDWKNLIDWFGVVVGTVSLVGCTGYLALGGFRAVIRLTRREIPSFSHCFAEVWALGNRLAGSPPAESEINLVEQGLRGRLTEHLNLLEAGTHTAEQVLELVVNTVSGQPPHGGSSKRDASPLNGEDGLRKLSMAARDIRKPEFTSETRLLDANHLEHVLP